MSNDSLTASIPEYEVKEMGEVSEGSADDSGSEPSRDFTVGRQPCQHFKAKMDGNAYATWSNVHCCYKCNGLVSFCETCFYDHHGGGYETCAALREHP